MIVRITQYCTMGCRHCLADASPQGAHMAWGTFQQTLTFCQGVGLPLILTGGEPTAHPQILKFLAYAKERDMPAAVLSNGLFLSQPAVRDRVLKLVQFVQVTNDPRYYPKHVPDYKHPKVVFDRMIQQLAPFGRAVTNGLECNRKSPNCYNLRSAVHTTKQLIYSLQLLGFQAKMCTPSINIDGTLVAGEAPSCFAIGTVWDSYSTIAQNIISMRCNMCGLIANLSPELRAVIGED